MSVTARTQSLSLQRKDSRLRTHIMVAQTFMQGYKRAQTAGGEGPAEQQPAAAAHAVQRPSMLRHAATSVGAPTCPSRRGVGFRAGVLSPESSEKDDGTGSVLGGMIELLAENEEELRVLKQGAVAAMADGKQPNNRGDLFNTWTWK